MSTTPSDLANVHARADATEVAQWTLFDGEDDVR
jgi:hypothetical protein